MNRIMVGPGNIKGIIIVIQMRYFGIKTNLNICHTNFICVFLVNSVYMTDMPPPYPGINSSYASAPPSYQAGAVGFNPNLTTPCKY